MGRTEAGGQTGGAGIGLYVPIPIVSARQKLITPSFPISFLFLFLQSVGQMEAFVHAR